jgi:hypothetical protein
MYAVIGPPFSVKHIHDKEGTNIGQAYFIFVGQSFYLKTLINFHYYRT